MRTSIFRALRAALPALATAVALAGCAAPGGPGPARADTASAPRPVKVLVISMFAPEGDTWLKNLPFDATIPVPGLAPEFPAVRCTASGVCVMTTGMGHANAAASTLAVALSDKLDLSSAYVLIAGIAGIDPNVGTIGDATFARYVVDYGIAHEIDAREMPAGWPTGYFGINAANPEAKPPFNYRTELFQVDEALLQKALALAATATLADNDNARAFRARYAQPTARRAPQVIQCDTASGDTYWHGRLLGERATSWTKVLTVGKGRYCTTQQEDNATFESLKRGAAAGRLDLRRVAVLRTASNFDRPYEGQSAYDSLKARSGGFPAAVANLFNAGAPLVNAIVNDWDRWKAGVPR